MKRLSFEDKPTKRVVTAHVPHGVRDSIVIAVYPGGIIGMRELGRRKEYTVEVGQLYVAAIRREVAERKAARKGRK